MRAFVRLTVALGLLAYGGFCESEGTIPSAEDADGAEADILHKIGNAIDALRKDGQSSHALRHALQQAVVNKTGHDKHHSRREKQVETIKQDFMALFQDIAEADLKALHLCEWDPTLDMAREELAGPHMIAMNLYNNAYLMPRIIHQMLSLLATLPHGTAFLSIYESNSGDSTGEWLRHLKLLLEALDYPHRILHGPHEDPAGGGGRIGRLAAIRNRALEPLWLSPEGLPVGAGKKAAWEASKVIFINDVAFCAKDAIRLASHNADIACGLDFAHYEDLSGAHFYDTWVARDIDGSSFQPDFPFVTDAYSLERMALGLPFPVKCCWNGMVAMNAAPIVRHGMRFRPHYPGECSASECSLMCNDFLRLNYSSIIVDPGVRLAYATDAAELPFAAHVVEAPVTSWADVLADPIDEAMAIKRPLYQCCDLQEGAAGLAWGSGEELCRWDNYMSPNYTNPAARPQEARGPVLRRSAKV